VSTDLKALPRPPSFRHVIAFHTLRAAFTHFWRRCPKIEFDLALWCLCRVRVIRFVGA
jgi:hypothetical protein